ncbi:hypothetical protein JRO89_XSUnG0197400 [Xanthoceras sorbifolium]|uniref:Uncharacterized protein n=1 Tax=Xanthoceras sorbifolium TaxID=99658 RepID=A0ABQ8GXA9_9ROSI|nr:hypothetical protein JRO89_XSUnG0197400 [Xanthoceras sorbifolium]
MITKRLVQAAVAEQQIMQMNDQPAAAQAQSMQMNDLQAAAQAQFMQMNNPATTEELWQMNEEMMRRMEEDQIKILENKIRERNADVIRYWSLYSQFAEAIGLVEKFVSNVPPESLERVNLHGNTALIIAAVSGNTEAAKVFVSKNKKLLMTAEVEDLTYESGAMLLRILIMSNLFGIPLQEEKNPYPLPERVDEDIEQTVRFGSYSAESEPFGFIQYIRATFGELRHKFNTMFWSALMQLAPSIRCMHDRKQMHTQTLEIVRMMIGDYSNWNYVKAIKLLKKPAFIAATLAIYEVVNEILKAYNFCRL